MQPVWHHILNSECSLVYSQEVDCVQYLLLYSSLVLLLMLLILMWLHRKNGSCGCYMLLYFCIKCFVQLKMADVALKEEANKKAFEKFAKESSSNSSVEAVQVSERYESQSLRVHNIAICSCNWNPQFITLGYFLLQVCLHIKACMQKRVLTWNIKLVRLSADRLEL